MKEKYLMLAALAMFFALVGSLASVVQSQVTYTDAVKINILAHDRGLKDWGSMEGIEIWEGSLVFPFAFSPQSTSWSITDFWISIVSVGLDGEPVTLTLNGVSTGLSIPLDPPALPMVNSIQVTATNIRQAVVAGINTLTLTIGNPYRGHYLHGIDIFLEYQYQYSGAAAVGGMVFPVDKFGLLAPYLGLASTIIVATVATTIYVKRAKGRKEMQ